MIRNLAVEGGRPLKNEDLTYYIQAFTMWEQLFSNLNHGNFIFQGCTFTDNGDDTYDISSGIIYYDSELCIFDGASAVELPYTLEKSRVATNTRTFYDSSSNACAETVEVVYNATGGLSLDEDTARYSDKFLRTAGNGIMGPIDGNNNEKTNIWKSLLSERTENIRQIGLPDGNDYYCKIGSLPIATQNQNITLLYNGGTLTVAPTAILKIKRDYDNSNNVGFVDYLFTTIEDVDFNSNYYPSFYIKQNDTDNTFDIWIKSNKTGVMGTSIIALLSESIYDTENNFTFEDTFTWQNTAPSSITEFTNEYPVKAVTQQIKIYIQKIGEWDMDTDSSVSVSLNQSFDPAKVINISASIIDDNEVVVNDINYDGGHVNLNRGTTVTDVVYCYGGDANSTDGYHTSTGVNRGYIKIEYIN